MSNRKQFKQRTWNYEELLDNPFAGISFIPDVNQFQASAPNGEILGYFHTLEEAQEARDAALNLQGEAA